MPHVGTHTEQQNSLMTKKRKKVLFAADPVSVVGSLRDLTCLMDQANSSMSRVAAIATKMDLTFWQVLSESLEKMLRNGKND